jgi:hypothetical protein
MGGGTRGRPPYRPPTRRTAGIEASGDRCESIVSLTTDRIPQTFPLREHDRDRSRGLASRRYYGAWESGSPSSIPSNPVFNNSRLPSADYQQYYTTQDQPQSSFIESRNSTSSASSAVSSTAYAPIPATASSFPPGAISYIQQLPMYAPYPTHHSVQPMPYIHNPMPNPYQYPVARKMHHIHQEPPHDGQPNIWKLGPSKYALYRPLEYPLEYDSNHAMFIHRTQPYYLPLSTNYIGLEDLITGEYSHLCSCDRH